MITQVRKITKKWFLLLLVSLTISGTKADIRLPKLISDGMILQRDSKIVIWGWANPQEQITIEFKEKIYNGMTDANGNWKLFIGYHSAGGPYTMTIRGKNQLQIKNILFGDVWLCSGQSNMELPMKRVKPLYETEIATANNQQIRYFAVPQKYNFKTPEKDYASGSWQKVTPATILNFSAVSYFFGKELNQQYNVPIGLINASLGGSPIQSWMSEDALTAFPDYLKEGIKFRNENLIREIETADNKRSNEWYAEANRKDAGHQIPNWEMPELDESNWLTTNVPGYWSETSIGNINGVVWFRKEFNISKEDAGKPAFLNLGRIVDADSTFINGKFIGTISYQYPPRWYNVPPNILVEGKNVIAVRIISNSGRGGFIPEKTYLLKTENTSIDLKGQWKMKLGCSMAELPSQTFVRWKPMGLFNAMIAPLTQYTKKGIVWYQGEANTDKPQEYKLLLPALINDWRTHFEQKNLPFIYAQLPNFMEVKTIPSESNWAYLRESQLKTLAVPNTGMAVTIDLGEWNDIHPLNKKSVGERLAKQAEQIAYFDKKVTARAPLLKSIKFIGNKAELTFFTYGNPLKINKNETTIGFCIADAKRQFAWAKATVRGNKIIVWNENIQHPVAVRYAWADNPAGANLMDSAGNMISPFRTDNW